MRHIHRSILLLICLTVLFASFVGAQTFENRKYYLRHSLIFFSDKVPEVSPQNIVFTDESICGFYPKVYDSPILNRNEEVRIISVDKNNEQANVVFQSGQKQFKVLLRNLSEKDFKKSFSLIFSEKLSQVKDEKVTSWKKAIEQFGFPIAKCKETKTEKWFYILKFSPNACGSFDGCVITVTKKGISISGYI